MVTTNPKPCRERRSRGDIDQLAQQVNESTNASGNDRRLCLVVLPLPNGKWRGIINGEEICKPTTWPFISAARALLKRGVDPNSQFEMWHIGAETWALRGRLGEVAAVRAQGERTPPQSARNRPLPRFGARI